MRLIGKLVSCSAENEQIVGEWDQRAAIRRDKVAQWDFQSMGPFIVLMRLDACDSALQLGDIYRVSD
ncbi:hypothetical protein C7G41_36315 [Bradyrhizobium sp. MOS002]|nr:hypothetical protein C7G41_36315 [Bradyrhizobium sp. MOS002]